MDSKNIEFGNLPFNEEQKNFVRKYAYWFDSPEDTKALIKEMAKAMEKTDRNAVLDVMENAQEEIDMLPDSGISFTQMHEAGYQNKGVLPLRAGRAAELYRAGLSVYGLNRDGSRVLMNSETDIGEHGGYFGVETREWESCRIEGADRQEKTYPPLYRETIGYAIENGEKEAFRDSWELNNKCKTAVEEAIRNSFDGMHLKEDAVKPVLEEYGAERLHFILANTVKENEWDARFSRDNVTWAMHFFTEGNMPYDAPGNVSLSVSSHPAVLNGFIDMFRREVPEQEKEMSAEQEDELGEKVEEADKIEPQEKQAETEVTLTVAECGEYHNLGDFYDNIATVDEAVAIWKQIPPERMHGIPAIGIQLHTPGTEPIEDVEIDILCGKRIDLDMLEFVPEIKSNPQAMEVIAELTAKAMALIPDMEIDGVMSEQMEAQVWEKRMPDLTPTEQLAVELDRFIYDHDTEQYRSNVPNMTETVAEITEALKQKDTRDIAWWLADIINDVTKPEEGRRALELLGKLTEYNPLAKSGKEKPSLKSRLAEKKAFVSGQERHEAKSPSLSL